MTANLYDASERAYAAKMQQFTSQPLTRVKRRRSSGGGVRVPTPAPVALASTTLPSPSPAPPLQPPTDRRSRNRMRPESDDVGTIGFCVRRASGAAGGFQPANLLQYSTRSCWQSFSRAKESVVLELCVCVYLSVGAWIA